MAVPGRSPGRGASLAPLSATTLRERAKGSAASQSSSISAGVSWRRTGGVGLVGRRSPTAARRRASASTRYHAERRGGAAESGEVSLASARTVRARAKSSGAERASDRVEDEQA